MNPTVKLQNWLAELHDQFGDKIPTVEKHPRIVNAIKRATGTTLKRYLGAGDNGIAFETNDNSVIKLSIDKNEAILWNRLRDTELPGIAKLKDVFNLVSQETGPTLIYLIHAEYVAHDLSPQQTQQVGSLLRTIKVMGTGRSKEEYVTDRTIRYINFFEDLAEKHPEFDLIPDMLMDLADKHKAHIYDLRPDNFKINNDGKLVLIDPSVPDLIGKIENPEPMLFEDQVAFILEAKSIRF